MVNLTLAADSAMKIGPQTVFQHRAALTTMQGDCTMADRDLPSPELLRKLLDYNPETGAMIWRERDASFFRDACFRSAESNAAVWNARYALKPAGTRGIGGYFRLNFGGWLCPGGKTLLSHRVAWALHYGEWPDEQIDHINHDTGDNRIANLRLATSAQNQHNRNKPRADNKSGFAGVSWHKNTGKWIAQIRIAGKPKHLGLFGDAREAHEAYLAAKRVAHPFSDPAARRQHLSNEAKGG